MKLTRVVVKNYRSVRHVDVCFGDFSIFVGRNNHGKTNFFEAIEWFYNAKSSDDDEHFLCEKENIISVELFFDGVIDSDVEKLTSEANKTKIRDLLGTEKSFSVRKTSSDHKRKYVVSGEDKGNPTGIDTAINEFLPRLEYIDTKIRLDDVSKFKDKNPIGTMLSGVLTAIVEGSTEYAEFKSQFSKLFDDSDSKVRQELDKLGLKVEQYLLKQFPDGTKVKFDVNPPPFGDLLKNFDTQIDDGVQTKAEAKGDGMQRAIMLAIIQAFADYRREHGGGATFLFMIDEAELHLHPSAQRALKKALLEICEKDQVLMNTHSSVFVVGENERQQIFRVEKCSSITTMQPVTAIDKIDIVFDLLGGSPADLLLPRNFLIVEGQSEFEFMSRVIKRFYPDKYLGIKILFARGDIVVQEKTLHAVHRLFAPLAGPDNCNPIYKDKAIILIDEQNKSQQKMFDDFKAGYPYLFDNDQVFTLPCKCLEEYYPAPYRVSKGNISNDEKVKYAISVADKISEQQFEEDMKVMFDALEACNRKGFSPVQ